jgi:hypothetical protein
LSQSLARAAPIRFLIAVAAVWTMARGVALTGWGPDPPLPRPARHQMSGSTTMSPLLAAASAPSPLGRDHAITRLRLLAARRAPVRPPMISPGPRATPSSRDVAVQADRQPALLMVASAAREQAYARASGLSQAIAPAPPSSTDRWSGSAWAFLRGGGRATSLSPGQIGGGQAGGRILYRLDSHLSAAARVSTAIGGARQTEAAIGLDWRPITRLPIHLMAERRVAIDSGGRNAWTLGAAGGVDEVHIAPGWRLDAYGEAGVVGAHRRDLYADGAMRVARAIDLRGGKSLAVGGGAWGAAQPGASRLDIGPSIVLRLPMERHAVAIALDWRERVLGHAKPGSGPALTIATDF